MIVKIMGGIEEITSLDNPEEEEKTAEIKCSQGTIEITEIDPEKYLPGYKETLPYIKFIKLNLQKLYLFIVFEDGRRFWISIENKKMKIGMSFVRVTEDIHKDLGRIELPIDIPNNIEDSNRNLLLTNLLCAWVEKVERCI
jgi:hypothetical protein